MTVERTLARAAADVAAGDARLARRRLRDLVAAFPTDLSVRDALAAAYRLEGDLPQAGRWSYLADDRDEAEVEAFRRRYDDDPVQLMRALAWRGSEDDAPTAIARTRLAEVRADAERATGVAQTWENPRVPDPPSSWGERIGCTLVALVGAAVVVLVLAGIVDLAARGWDALQRWFG
ncbi:DUF6584 family protein [Cellulomonas massiliensis]|uniref:DUF6584 family protein n=1 Tax=Cellulomonas massiliensis TaxID=1465811 RepID=UPI0002EA8B69|nr:DUF6584 family protein [Cellulomonas massiliensis]